MDKMTIVGTDGQDRYLVDESNRVIDLRYCACPEKSSTQQNGEQLICLVCGLPIHPQP